jgi:O-antigen/teichoic acid export membrane protein
MSEHGAFLRKLTGAVAVQAMLSASNFIVGLLLVRRTTDMQYGYYVLVTTAVVLATTLQGSFIQPPMIIRLTRADRVGRSDLIGGLYRDQRRLIPYAAVLAALLAIVLHLTGNLSWQVAGIILVGTIAVMAAMNREFLRMVLFAYRRPNDVLAADFFYCLLLVGGAYLATFAPLPATIATGTLALACVAGGLLLSRTLWRYEPWNRQAPKGALREIAPQGIWSAFGAMSHWLFSQGYNYVVTGAMDVTAVAALAATRLLVMPVGLLSTGIGSLLLPTTSKWTKDHAPSTVLIRLALVATALAATASCYLLLTWLTRDWIFENILKKHFEHRDLLLALWSAIAVITVFRDQLLHFLAARALFRATSTLTFASAIISFCVSFAAMQYIGATGALLGLLAGEFVNVLGIVIMSIRETRSATDRLASNPG